MTCKNCGKKVGECPCEEILVVSVDNGERVEFIKMTYAEMEKFNRMDIDATEVHCYPLESIPIRTAEYVATRLS